MLVGDAGHFKDPAPAQGISDALRQGQTLAEAIEAGLSAGGLDRRLADWWRWRDDDAWEMYWFATDLGAAGPTPRIVREMLSSLTREPAGAERFLRLLNHQLEPSELFTPGRALRAVVRAASRRPKDLSRLLAESRTLATEELRRWRTRRHPEAMSSEAAAATGS